MTTSLVDNLRPVARDQFKPSDKLLRATWSSAQNTSTGTVEVLKWDMAGYASFSAFFTGDSNSFIVQGSNDGINWVAVDTQVIGQGDAPSVSTFAQNNAAPTLLVGNKQTRFMRIISTGSISSTHNTGISVVRSQVPFITSKSPLYASATGAWSYVAASGGITDTTAVTMKSAPGTYRRNWLRALQVSNGHASVGTEIIVADSLGSTIWRDYLVAGGRAAVTFDPPLRLTANGAVTVQCGTTGSKIYANAQGFSGNG